MESNAEYPTSGTLYLDGHCTNSIQRETTEPEPMLFQHMDISESSCVPYLFSPLVVTGETAHLLPANLADIGWD